MGESRHWYNPGRRLRTSESTYGEATQFSFTCPGISSACTLIPIYAYNSLRCNVRRTQRPLYVKGSMSLETGCCMRALCRIRGVPRSPIVGGALPPPLSPPYQCSLTAADAPEAQGLGLQRWHGLYSYARAHLPRQAKHQASRLARKMLGTLKRMTAPVPHHVATAPHAQKYLLHT